MQQDTHKELAVWQFETIEIWRDWLEHNHNTCPTGIWVKIAKKNKGVTTITYEEAREGALCYGWIDSVPNKLNDTFYLLKLTPRRPRSIWSKINVDLCEIYIADGRMQPAGLKEVLAARQDGRWDAAYGSQQNAEIPDDLAAALAANKKAMITFERTNNTNRQAIIFQIITAKKPETRLRRLVKYVDMLAVGSVPFSTKSIPTNKKTEL